VKPGQTRSQATRRPQTHNRTNDFSKVSEVWEYKDSPGIQADSATFASGWHLSPFVRSLQLAFYGLCVAWHLQSAKKTPTT